ncbi:hypothetical protein ACFOW4_21275 [Micromonospora sp. GCM10011542]|uniref:hypothetical protein n=1 Tax=Micromonospora sp. GCM10011542 TaxID=3317337 RepID=UPI0036176712
MSVRRHAARLATVCAVLGGLLVLGSSPALAEGDSVRVRSAGSFTAGGSTGGVNVEVRRRTAGCVLPRTALGLRLVGVSADQVAVQVNAQGEWRSVPVTGDGGNLNAAPTMLGRALCKGKTVTVRYRVAFAAGTPNGRLVVTGEATNASGQALGRGSDSSRVVGGQATGSPSPTRKPSPTPSATTAPASTDVEPALAAAVGTGGTRTTAAEATSSGGSKALLFGIGMVAVGLLLIVLLVRRSRQDKASDPVAPTVPLPRNPGGTTYRSGAPGPTPPPAGAVYGKQPAASGSVYGTRPPEPPAAAAGPAASVPPRPGTPPDEADGGDHTTVMPRLPG